MQNSIRGDSMEILFEITLRAFLLFSLAMCYLIARKIEKNLETEKEILQGYREIFRALKKDVEHIHEKAWTMVLQLDAIPDIVKEDNSRILGELIKALETPMPMKPNNWDSLKTVFTRPARIDKNE